MTSSRWGHRSVAAALILGAMSCAPSDRVPEDALAAITAEGLAAQIDTLSSDAFEGRAPSSPGEERTVTYLETEFEKLGLEPGNEGSWVQEVPLVSLTANPDAKLTIQAPDRRFVFDYGSDFMAWTKRVVGIVSVVRSEMVFVGYGVVAPEWGWNDYEGTDVRGKTVVILVNDPGFARKDTSLFDGRAMTYYGRWTYKYEEAARQGAAAALIVHETEPAGYPWEVVVDSWKGVQFDLVREDEGKSRVAVEGWIQGDRARELFRAAGFDYDSLKLRADQRGFKPVPLGFQASVALRNTVRRSVSRNVVGVLPGSRRPNEVVIYMAHWDHLGRDTTREGDQIFNGALDNASGTSGLLELAKAFTSLPTPPARSVVFLSVTAEEKGLLGSAYYGTHPIWPPAETVAAINMDGLDIYGRMRDIVVVGYGKSQLDDYLTRAAQTQGRRVEPDPEPEKGFYYRSDHFSLAKVGIPALYTDAGVETIEHGAEWARARRDEYTAQRYHKPSDEYDPSWDLSGAVEDLQLLFDVGYWLATGKDWPNWREGTEFKAARDAQRGR